jgi:hypothetical protein
MFVYRIYKQIKTNMGIPKFNEYNVDEAIVAAGFGSNPIYGFGINTGYRGTGYDMTPIVGTVNDTANSIASHANTYETNDNKDHKGDDFIKEAKNHINETIDKAYEGCKSGVTETTVTEDRFGHPITALGNQIYIQLDKMEQMLSGKEKNNYMRARSKFWKITKEAMEAEEQKESNK